MITNSYKKRGRPANVPTFVKVKIIDLLRVFNADASIVVSNRWLKQVGVKIHSIDHTPKV